MAESGPQVDSAIEGPAAKASKRIRLPSVLRPLDLFGRRERLAQNQNLSFYQRHFTRSLPGSSGTASTSAGSITSSLPPVLDDKTPAPSTSTTPVRRFYFLSRGAVLSALLVTAIVIAVLVPVLVTQIAKHDTRIIDGYATGQGSNSTGYPISPNSASDPLAYQYSMPPIRLGALTNFPDPSLHYDISSSTWYAFATNNGAGILQNPGTNTTPTDPVIRTGSNVQLATSTDFLTWTILEDASDPLPTVGAWARQGSGSSNTSAPGDGGVSPGLNIQGIHQPLANVWAPDVIQHPSQPNSYLLYYSAVSALDPLHHHCIGAATATTPAGPYTPVAEAMACSTNIGGAIDPVAAIDVDDNNAIYVAYKVDGNSIGHGGECGNTFEPIVPTPIMLQRMSADGVTPDATSPAIQLLDRTDVDGPLIEAPSLVKVNATWYLFYSSGCTRNPDYNVRYATAPKITGPYTRHADPLLATGNYSLMAPGSVSVRWTQDAASGGTSANDGGSADAQTVNGGWKIALHGRVRTERGGVRAMFTAGLTFSSNGTVTLVEGIA